MVARGRFFGIPVEVLKALFEQNDDSSFKIVATVTFGQDINVAEQMI